ncbi:hypothetical protein [Rosistilla ulvae]|nr:hypothetical protein [Rosistilla ulvae]
MINVCETLLEAPPQKRAVVEVDVQRSVAPRSARQLAEIELATEELADAGRADSRDTDHAIWGCGCDWIDEAKVEPPKVGQQPCCCDDDEPLDEGSDELDVANPMHPESNSFSPADDQHPSLDLPRIVSTNERGLFSIFAIPTSVPELEAPIALTPGSTPVARSAVAYRYFSDSTKSSATSGGTLKSEALANYATQESFVAFTLLDLDDVHPPAPVRNLAAESAEESATKLVVAPASTAVTRDSTAGKLDCDAVLAAQRAIDLANATLRDADVAVGASDACGCVSANDAGNQASSETVGTICASQDATPGSDRNSMDAFCGKLKLGVVSVVSILFSIRSISSDGDRKGNVGDAVRSRSSGQGLRTPKARRADRIADCQIFGRE